ncbi:MAG: serine/threonine-protein kinase PknK, partial [Planctomycetes bacterium]|nr:serine/threonine-protein kinase PknK [Planctomycetota bacterium]
MRRLGEGGFGAVYLGHDEDLDIPLAIKVPSARLLATTRAREEFLREVRIVARLRHDAIVRTYGFRAEGNDQFYIAYEFIEGETLADRIGRSRIPHADAARLAATVADALHYAHLQELYHRDIKPSNILLDRQGRPYVTDFGLAVKEEELSRHRGRLAGTPQYMAPEQVRREGHRVGNRTDIYSLGVVLYEMLCGRRPFSAESNEELFEQIEFREPRPPRSIDDTIPRELERICLKAMSKKVTDRYNTAADMAEELRLALAGISAAPPSQLPAQLMASSNLPGGPGVGYLLPEGMSLVRSVVQSVSGVQERMGTSIVPAVAPGPPALPAHVHTPVGAAAATPPDSAEPIVRVIPKGLRSFDETDKEFFLELLPGPRDRDGIPDSIRFWKTHIEQVDPDSTFSVGLIYGPSGSGKSSLVKAGLLPRLASSVIPIYIEASRDDTEARLVRQLSRACPKLVAALGEPMEEVARKAAQKSLDSNVDRNDATVGRLAEGHAPDATRPGEAPPSKSARRLLADLIAILRLGEVQPEGKKTLIVLDQFEQWLHAHGQHMEQTELVAAMRQADGAHIQFVLMVRDDFWLANSRLFHELETPLAEGHNLRLVDLFDTRHARRVLQLFGQAYGCLPQRLSQVSAEQNTFLDQVVRGLSENGKVISVRLSLFADLMKGRPWTIPSLKEVGGTEGVGITFLEETFSARTASPEHKVFEKPARALLAALLPETGSEIKGPRRSRAELLEASGLQDHPHLFDRLLNILDSELRIITPTEPDEAAAMFERIRNGAAEASDPRTQRPTGAFYQLTHDYLFRPLRQWLTEKKQDTWRGRAELRLEEHTAEWIRQRRGRYLPNPFEYVTIVLGVPNRKRTPDQKGMMRVARRRYSLAALTLVFLSGVFGWLGWDWHGRMKAEALALSISSASIDQVPSLIHQIEPYRRWLEEPLTTHFGDADNLAVQLRRALLLLPVDPSQRQYLIMRLLDSRLDANFDDFKVIRDSLKPADQDLKPADPDLLETLWAALKGSAAWVGEEHSVPQSPELQFRAGLALAEYSPESGWT